MAKSANPGYRPGDHNAICDRCGFVFRASELRKTWDNLWVCKQDWEPRQPQDFVRGRPDKITPSGPLRPDENAGQETIIVVKQTPSGVAGEAIAGCAIVGLDVTTPKIPLGTNNNSL